MLDVLRAKIKDQNLRNIEAVYLDSARGDAVEGRYHLVVSSMTLHHVRDVEPFLRRFHEIILPGGHVCIADLDSDDGQFHGENDSVFHHGLTVLNCATP